MPEISLDDPTTYSALDPDDMYRRVNDLPRQIEDAWRIAGDVDLPEDYRSAKAALIAGMGGSAIGGTLLQSYGSGAIPIPVAVSRSYEIPGWVDSGTLFIAISYSGNTEETLAATDAAHDRGARLLAITTGGKLEELVREWNVPILTFSYDAQPRATLGYLFTPLLHIFARLGFLPRQEAAIDAALRTARAARNAWKAEVPVERNLAKQIARDVAGRIAVIYGAEYLAGVAHRWKTQMNENAKNWAFFEEFSELNHNAIVGYEYPESGSSDIQVIVLGGTRLSSRICTRMDVTQELLDQFQVRSRTVRIEADGKLAEMVQAIVLGDYVTYYLALLNGADPTEIKPIDFLKDRLSGV